MKRILRVAVMITASVLWCVLKVSANITASGDILTIQSMQNTFVTTGYSVYTSSCCNSPHKIITLEGGDIRSVGFQDSEIAYLLDGQVNKVHTTWCSSYELSNYHGHNCDNDGGALNWGYGRATSTTISKSLYNLQQTNFNKIIIKNCVVGFPNLLVNTTLRGTIPVEITGGQYRGSPAINSSSIIVNKGTITDNPGSDSTFMLGEDSEQTVVKDSLGTTITTVKLSNPPIIIDWADFPG